MRRAAKVDGNHAEIVEAYRKAGCSVLSLAQLGGGVPDLLVAKWGMTWLVEVKMLGGKENQLQRDWAKTWRGTRSVVRTVDDVLTDVYSEKI